MMTNIEKLWAFFEAENQRNWATYQTFLADDIVWTLEGQEKHIFRGKATYLEKIKAAYKDEDTRFSCIYHQASSGQERIVTILQNDLGQLSCDIFEFKDGLIVKEWEYLLQ
ncbi:SnoaL-like domain [Streptococcus massiliensis]|uniref:SnoaL-like domain n=2 Tax=Streptococcus massiliensis TaxID=313439 RepID=A0A380KY92_9STRE|nr:SnoaL-like domain [Streptococcus massiliensis]